MGFWSWFTGLFSSGVKVLLWKYDETLKKSDPVINGAVLIKGGANKTVLKMEVKVIQAHTWTEEYEDDGETKKRQKTEETVLGSVKFPGDEDDIGFPLTFTTAGDKEQPFCIHVAVNDRLRGHSTSTAGKLLGFASGEKVEYFIAAEASVKGSILGASAREKLTVAE
jgi:hypothetical protein